MQDLYLTHDMITRRIFIAFGSGLTAKPLRRRSFAVKVSNCYQKEWRLCRPALADSEGSCCDLEIRDPDIGPTPG